MVWDYASLSKSIKHKDRLFAILVSIYLTLYFPMANGMLYFQEGYTQKTKVMLMDKKDNQGDIENYKGKYTPT